MVRFICDRIEFEIDERAILYIETKRNGTIMHTLRNEYSMRRPLSEWRTILNRSGFEQCHEGYLVNLRRTARVEGLEVVLENGCRIPVSRRRKTAFYKAFFIIREENHNTP